MFDVILISAGLSCIQLPHGPQGYQTGESTSYHWHCGNPTITVSAPLAFFTLRDHSLQLSVMPSRSVCGFKAVDGTYVCIGGCGFVCKRARDARQHSLVCGAVSRDVIVFQCTTCSFSTAYRANLSKHIRVMHVQTSAHLCRCGKPCTGILPSNAPADD